MDWDTSLHVSQAYQFYITKFYSRPLSQQRAKSENYTLEVKRYVYRHCLGPTFTVELTIRLNEANHKPQSTLVWSSLEFRNGSLKVNYGQFQGSRQICMWSEGTHPMSKKQIYTNTINVIERRNKYTPTSLDAPKHYSCSLYIYFGG